MRRTPSAIGRIRAVFWPMKLDRFIRLAIGVVVTLLVLMVIAALLFVTESALNVWARLRDAHPIFLYGYFFALLALLAAAFLLIRRVGRGKPGERSAAPEPPSRENIEERLREADQAGVDVADAQAELAELAARQAAGSINLCFYGEISTGKSSLIKALAPAARVQIDVAGGSTTDIRHYRWRDKDGTEILLTDVPGTGGTEAGLSELALEEARRAQVVVYVCEGDLTRGEKEALESLFAVGKPLVLVMNKSDRYDAAEQAQLMERLLDHLNDIGSDIGRDRVVAVSAGGETDIIERLEDGTERRAKRRREADIGVLVVAINRLLEDDRESLDTRRDRAVFELATEKLVAAEARYREQRSEQIVRASTRKAVIGALAAVSPGTDVVIQGYIATTMAQELSKLYGVAPRDLDIEQFLSLSESRAGKALPLALAVAGNGLKAFPGVGTVAGGLVHAVAYGLIFDALGRSLVRTLSSHGELVPEVAAKEFEDSISEHIEAGVRKVAEMAVDQARHKQ